MSKRLISAGLILALLAILGGLSGCTVTLTSTNTVTDSDVSGVLVDARSYSATGISGATVTLASISNSSYTVTTTTDSLGNFSFTGLDSTQAPYEITFSATGYFAPPVRVNNSGYSISLGYVPALSLSSSDVGGLSFIAVWNAASGAKIDEYMSFPDSDQSSTEPSFTTPYSDTFTDTRAEVYYQAPVFPTSGTATVYLNNNSSATSDSSGAGVITLRSIPFTYSTYTQSTANYPVTMNSSNDLNGLYAAFGTLLPSGTQFRYMGAAEVYLNAPTGSLTSSTSAASNPNLTIYCVQTVSGPNGSLLSTFQLPQDTTLTSASVARVNLFLYYTPTGSSGACYQIVPDQRAVPQGPSATSTPFKSLVAGTPIFGALAK
ncbi:MAG: carboxypeptidase regulatory-like domain-containing protein [Spirochaetales bacterium]|nr:carboxypeptidase regulatory-like domain-containing protein [Spirochaetales bacterium]